MKFTTSLFFVVVCIFNSSVVSAFRPKYAPSGALVRWSEPTVMINVSSSWPTEYRGQHFPAEIFAAYEVWNGIPSSDFSYVLTGVSPAGASPSDGKNLVIYESSVWTGPAGVLATTIMAYNTRSGEILDADTLVNGVEFAYPRHGANSGAGEYDQVSVIVHEAGHALGLEHVPDTMAVMHSGLAPGQRKRHLSEDDRLGVRTLYPAGADSSRGCMCQSVSRSAKTGDLSGALCCTLILLYWLIWFKK